MLSSMRRNAFFGTILIVEIEAQGLKVALVRSRTNGERERKEVLPKSSRIRWRGRLGVGKTYRRLSLIAVGSES